MSKQALLPEGFESLQPFVGQWALASANDRLQARLNSTAQEREAFFNAGKDLVAAALERLDQKPIAEFDDKEQRLMQLALSLAHISLAEEIQRDDEPFHARYARFITITRASADGPSADTGSAAHVPE